MRIVERTEISEMVGYASKSEDGIYLTISPVNGMDDIFFLSWENLQKLGAQIGFAVEDHLRSIGRE